MRHDETWKLETEPRQDIQVSRVSHCKTETRKTMRQDTHLETPSLCIFPSLMLQLSLGYGLQVAKNVVRGFLIYVLFLRFNFFYFANVIYLKTL